MEPLLGYACPRAGDGAIDGQLLRSAEVSQVWPHDLPEYVVMQQPEVRREQAETCRAGDGARPLMAAEIVKCPDCHRRCVEDVEPYSHQYWTCPRCHQIVLRKSIDAMRAKHAKSLEKLGGH